MNTRQFLGCAALLCSIAAYPAIAASKSEVADAAANGDVAAVRTLIVKKADVNTPQVDGATALHWAVHLDNAEMVEALIKAGAKPNVANREGSTPLSLAAINGNPRVIEALLKGGADAKAKGPSGETMLMLAARNGSPAAIKLIAAAGADVNAKETTRGTTALMWAAEQRHPEAVKALLELGADPSARSGGAGLPRNYMAQRVNTRAVEEAQKRRERAKEAGRTYEEQLEWENANGVPTGGRSNAPGGAIQPGQPAAPAGGNAAAGGAAPAAGGAQAGAGGGRRGGRGGGQGRQGGQGQAAAGRAGAAPAAAAAANGDQGDDSEVVVAGLVGSGGGGLTAMIFAAREGDLESTKALLEHGAKVNQVSEYGWTPLLTAVNNRNYELAIYLLDHGADPNLANKGGWTPLYIATDNRNIEGGDYPVPKPDLDHMAIIKALVEHGADVNAVVKENTLTRTIFTMQWFFESGASPFLRAAQSSDVELMKYLLDHGADPKVRTDYGDTALTAAAGIGWVDGVTYERSAKENVEAVRMLLDLGLDPNTSNSEGRTPLMGAALKGRNDVVQLLVDRGAKLETRDRGSRDTHIAGASIAGHTWQALDYSEGLVRVGVQSAVARPETAKLIRKLMKDRGLPVPPENRTVQSICITDICQGLP
jgi:ankyrin repeat protein